MSDLQFPKLSVEAQMAIWRDANQEKRAEIMAEHVFKTSNAVFDLQESRRRHHIRIATLEDERRGTAPPPYRNPEDSATFVLTEHELEKAREALKKHDESDMWVKRLWIGGIISVLVALAIATITVTAKVIIKAAVLGG